MKVSPILIAIPAFFLFIAIELIIGWRKRQKLYRFNDAITNLNIGIGSQVFGAFSKAALLALYILVYDSLAIIHQPTTWWSFVLALFTFDFIFYWAHRWGHETNIFWGAHVVHHQSEEYNLSVALRQSWIHNIIAFVLFLPMPVLGFDPKIFLAAAATHTLYQFWIHTKTIKKMPRIIEFLFNTPSHHRVHHGVNPKYIDKNHGGVFIIWDRLFGTFQAEEEEPTYGITTQLKSWNPVWANSHYYIEMFQRARQMKWADRIKLVFAKPGWLPDYLGGYQAPPEVDKANYKAYDTQTTLSRNVYVFVQFLMIAVGLAAYMFYFPTISLFFQIVFFGILILSTLICGAILENKRWVVYIEYLRLMLIGISLNSFYYYWYMHWFTVVLVVSCVAFILFALWFTLSWLFDKQWFPEAIRK
ncbi:MAG: sterol desaturase family protein [Chitinophagales bacterium]|nr:sterol desaturase family protein [Chitinophagales bacterium]